MKQEVVNELTKEIIVTHTVTASRLLKKGKVGVNAFTLYNFYCWVASWQLSNKVKATDKFCLRGLHWGKKRLLRAKQLLIKEGIVETVVRKDKEGKISGHFIHIHYLNGFTPKPEVLPDTSGSPKTRGMENHRVVSRTTIALDKKRSALDKNKRGGAKKYSSLKSLSEKDFVEISQEYKVPLALVKLQHEKMVNWVKAKGKRYKNYRRALMNWVIRAAESKMEKSQNNKYRAVDARGVK